MMFNVPQFIDVEDKIAGPLTWRQLLWMIGMGAVLFLLYNMLPRAVFYVTAVFTILFFSALAFYRPNNQPLIMTAIHGVMFLFRPKVAMWERPTHEAHREKKEAPKPIVEAPRAKKVTMEELKNLAHIVDSHGRS